MLERGSQIQENDENRHYVAVIPENEGNSGENEMADYGELNALILHFRWSE
jgi:hypothetical protein